MTEVTLRLSTATIEAFTAAYGEKHWQRKAAISKVLAPCSTCCSVATSLGLSAEANGA